MTATKEYVNYFSEIKGLPTNEQEEILEQARYESFVVLKLNDISIGAFFLPLLLGFSGIFLSIVFFGFLSLYNIVALIIFPLFSLYLTRILYGAILRKGLVSVLSKQKE